MRNKIAGRTFLSGGEGQLGKIDFAHVNSGHFRTDFFDALDTWYNIAYMKAAILRDTAMVARSCKIFEI